MMSHLVGLKVVVLASVMAMASLATAQASSGPITFQPGPDLQKRVLSAPAGASNSSKKATIGNGQASINTGDPNDTFWTETLDLSGAGNIVNAEMLWDTSSKILYSFAHMTLRCTHGKSIDGNILVGIYGKKNFLGKAPGSGWWVVDLQQGQCQAPMTGLYGCKFGPNGGATVCGRAELDARINDMAIVEATKF